MIYSIAIYGAPYTYQATDTAYQFAAELLKQGHSIHRIFFYHDGVYNASKLTVPPQDEVNISGRWADFAAANKVELLVCVAYAIRRGMLDAPEASRYEKDNHNVHDSFTISGLGQLIDVGITSDRLITFGP